MKQWFLRVAQIALAAVIGSFVLANLSSLAVWRLIPQVHDVQFALTITVISGLGGILGAVSAIILLLAKARRFAIGGWLALVFGFLGLAFSVPEVVHAEQLFGNSNQPIIDALAYVGFTLAWSIGLVIWGVLLLFKKAGTRAQAPAPGRDE